MQLIKFLTIGVIISIIFGEFGHYPFGETAFALRLTDILLSVTLGFLCIWQVGIQKKVFFHKLFLYIVLFWFIGFVSLIISGNLGGIFYLLRFILYSLTFFLGFSLIKSKIVTIREILSWFVICGLLLTGLGFMQLFLFPDFEILTAYGFDPHKFRLASTFLDPNYLGAFLNITILFSYYLFRQTPNKKLLFVNLIFAVSIVLTLSRSALLMFFMSVFLLGIFKDRRLLAFLLLASVFISLFIPSTLDRIYKGFTVDESAAERIVSWNNGLTLFKQKPIFGVGFNNLRDSLEENNLIKVYSDDGGHAGGGIDSSLIFILATTGVLGFLAYLSWWIFLIKDILQKIKSDSYLGIISVVLIVGLFINSQFVNSLFYTPILLVIFIYLGATLASED